MGFIKKYLVYFFGWSLIGSIFYCFLSTIVYLASIFALLSGVVLQVPILSHYQKGYYFDGGRAIFQYDPACVQSDKDLIYKPKLGGCNFSNAEFSSQLNFDTEGRFVPARANLTTGGHRGIAVIGDSYAMGWGVNDHETFSNVLQTQVGRPVYNLGVSSYGTERQLKSLIMSGIMDKIDTVVIQYCDNDLGENFKNPKEMYSEKVLGDYAKTLEEGQKKQYFYSGLYAVLKKNISRALLTPHSVFFGQDQRSHYIDFAPHSESIQVVLKRYYRHLQNKKVILLYLNEDQRQFINYPTPQLKAFKNMFFMTPNLNEGDFFAIDGHLNDRGNQALGLQLADFLKNLN